MVTINVLQKCGTQCAHEISTPPPYACAWVGYSPHPQSLAPLSTVRSSRKNKACPFPCASFLLVAAQYQQGRAEHYRHTLPTAHCHRVVDLIR